MQSRRYSPGDNRVYADDFIKELGWDQKKLAYVADILGIDPSMPVEDFDTKAYQDDEAVKLRKATLKLYDRERDPHWHALSIDKPGQAGDNNQEVSGNKGEAEVDDQKDLTKMAPETTGDKDSTKKRSLGRGLATFFPDYDFVAVHAEDADLAAAGAAPTALPIDQVKPGQFQPRIYFDQEQLQTLAESITQKGVLQPILVRPLAEGGYEIVAGERRYRAAQLAKLTTIPVVIKELTDREALEIGLIENLHRQDLSPIEEAQGYKSLMEKFDYTQDSLSQNISKSPSHVSNTLRLLDLPETVQTMLQDGRLSFSHAKLLLTTESPQKIAEKIVAKDLSVRETEQLIAQQKRKQGNYQADKQGSKAFPEIQEIQDRLESVLQIKVKFNHLGPSGRLIFQYKNLEELDKILQAVTMSGMRRP